MTEVNLNLARKGRGAASNREGRFESLRTLPFDDGWGTLEAEPPAPLKTEVGEDAARTIIARNQSPDIPFEQSINPYRGCEHGCVYCYARPTHAYWGLSAGLDFETKLFKKSKAPELLETALRKPGYVCKPITLGANTDAYQPIERRYRITRRILEILHAYRHPVALITKSALVLRDFDILSEMAKLDLAFAVVSVTTLDPALARLMEPRAAAPHRRLETLKALGQAGIPTAVNAAPMIPALNDSEMERILEAGANAGARSAGYILVRLPYEVKDLFKEWLETHFPLKAAHVMSLIRQARGGKENQSRFGARMRGKGPYAELLRKRFKLACKRWRLNRDRFELNVKLFQPPPRAGDQLSLFAE